MSETPAVAGVDLPTPLAIERVVGFLRGSVSAQVQPPAIAGGSDPAQTLNN